MNAVSINSDWLANRPADRLTIVTVRNCVVTRSSLVLTWRGVERASLFDNIPAVLFRGMQRVGVGSLLRNRLSVLRSERPLYHIFNIWGTGYHHWLTEVAPKLFLFEQQIRQGTFILPERTPEFIFEFLSEFGFDNYVHRKGNAFVRELQVITNPNSGHYSAGHLAPLLKAVLEKYGQCVPARRRIYVSRRNSRGRKVVNDAEVSEFLASRGFEILELENVRFRDQVRIFSSCELLISIHGAALTNLMFMPAGGRVVEFYPSGFSEGDYFNACYKRLSSVAGIEHEYLFCRREKEASAFDLHNDNIVVDVGQLEMAATAAQKGVKS
ncbi:MAG: glycosyltransferase family 61 protein [Pyrinomonadaceae bacterium]